MHRVLGVFDIRFLLGYEVLHRRWRFRECARLIVLNDKMFSIMLTPYSSHLACRPWLSTWPLQYVILQPSFIFTHLLSPITISHSLPLPLPSPTNNVKVILTITFSCAPLLSPTPFLALPLILFKPRSAILSELADDQPSRLASPSLFLIDVTVLTHLYHAFLSFVYGSLFVGLTCQSHIDYG
jgi:hypothetical protein